MSYSGYALDELRALFIEKGNALSVLAESRREIEIEINARVKAAAAKSKISRMDRNEKDALMVALKSDVEATK